MKETKQVWLRVWHESGERKSRGPQIAWGGLRPRISRLHAHDPPLACVAFFSTDFRAIERLRALYVRNQSRRLLVTSENVFFFSKVISALYWSLKLFIGANAARAESWTVRKPSLPQLAFLKNRWRPKLFGRNVFEVFINVVSNVNKSLCQAQILILKNMD